MLETSKFKNMVPAVYLASGLRIADSRKMPIYKRNRKRGAVPCYGNPMSETLLSLVDPVIS